MGYIIEGFIAGAVSIVCLLLLTAVVTLDNAITDKEEDTDSEESFISWLSGLWLMWLMCFFAIVVVLMRLCDGGQHFLYRLSSGMVALIFVPNVVQAISSSRWGSLIFNTYFIYFYVQECCRQSPPVTEWWCNAQMWILFSVVAAFFFFMTTLTIVGIAMKDPMYGVLELTEMAIIGILTVSCFVVSFLVPPVIIPVEDPPDPLAQEEQNKGVSSSNVEYERA
jgi:hypothetical protein